jgi:hypothetical protein
VVEFRAIHDFGAGMKGAGMLCKEMGESGEGSLEHGVASGAEFVVSYPNPFLEHYWAANKDELDPTVRSKLYPTDVTEQEEDDDGEADAAPAAEQTDGKMVKEEKAKPPLFDHLDLASSTLNVSGPRRGGYTNKYTCSILTPSGVCGASVTLYQTKGDRNETTSNAWTHLRQKVASGCKAHETVLLKLNETNSKVVKDAAGEFVNVQSFEEAFPHHVDYVWCRASGIFSARMGTKPLFRRYVRGVCSHGRTPHPCNPSHS